MPTILRFGAFRIMIYTDDHEPAHVHVSGKGGLVISYLDAQSRLISVRDNRNVSKRDVRSIADFLVGNLDICLQRGSNYMVSDAEYKAATRRGREMRKHVPHAISAHYDECLQRVLVRLSNRLELALNPADHQTLHNATAEQLSDIELWGAGYELFFPKPDDGVYVRR